MNNIVHSLLSTNKTRTHLLDFLYHPLTTHEDFRLPRVIYTEFLLVNYILIAFINDVNLR